MNKLVKAAGIAIALAVMIPLSAYAASNTGTNPSADSSGPVQFRADAVKPGHGPGRGGQAAGIVSQDVLDLLKLDKQELREQLAAGKTLADIAEAQGVTRDALKQAMTDAFAKRQAQQKQKFDDNLDGIVDGKLKDKLGAGLGRGPGRAGIPFMKDADLSAVAKQLGITSDELRESLKDGKSIADIAAEKNVDVQTLVDAAKTALVERIDQAVKDGKLTQEQADKQIAGADKIADNIINGKGFGPGPRGHRPDRAGQDASGIDGANGTSDAAGGE